MRAKESLEAPQQQNSSTYINFGAVGCPKRHATAHALIKYKIRTVHVALGDNKNVEKQSGAAMTAR